MAQFSGLWSTSGAGSGDQQVSYNQLLDSRKNAVLAACNGFEGVAPGYLNALEGTVTGANTVSINTGGALVDGKYYYNDAAASVNIPSAVGGGYTRFDRIVLRCSWASFTVRITRIAGTDAASPSIPAITQTTGTTYDIALFYVQVDTGGTVTLWDERVFAGGLPLRSGGNALAWMVPGSTIYPTGNMIMQSGTATSSDSVVVVVPFCKRFSYEPIVFVQAYDSGGTGVAALTAVPYNIDASLFYASVFDDANARVATDFFWLAIGPA